MTIKGHILRTTSEIAMGRYMRAPDHPTQGDEDFGASFDQFSKDDGAAPAAGADDKGGEKDGSAEAAAAGGPGGAGGTDGDGASGAEGGADGGTGGAAPAADAGAADAGAGKAPAEAGTEGAADTAAAAAQSGKEPADKGKGKGKKGASAAAAAEVPAGESDADDVLKRLAAAVTAAGGKKDEPTAPAAEAKEEPPIISAEEEAKIEGFKKEWPEVAEAFDIQSRVLAHSVLKYAFGQIAEQFIPLRDMVESLATRTHYGDLKEKVGDYTDEERNEIVDWVAEQPTYLQKAMMSVIEEGTAEEVADLVQRYRKDTGKQPAGAQVDTPAPSGGETELSDEAKKAAAALAPVSSKRSAVQAAEDSSDFDGAFTKFADQLG